MNHGLGSAPGLLRSGRFMNPPNKNRKLCGERSSVSASGVITQHDESPAKPSAPGFMIAP